MTRALVLALFVLAACDLRPEDFSRVESSAARFRDVWGSRLAAASAKQQQLQARAQALPQETPGLGASLTSLSTVAQTLTELSTTKLPAMETDIQTRLAARHRRGAEDAIRQGSEDLAAAMKEVDTILADQEVAVAALEEAAKSAPQPEEPVAEKDTGEATGPLAPPEVDINDRAFAQKVGEASVPGVVFKPGTADPEFNDSTKAALMRLIALANACDQIRLELVAHTAKDGDARLNRRLSQAQAEAVRQYLINSGVAPAKVAKATGVGGAQPLVPEPDAGSAEETAMATDALAKIRATNRRLTVKVATPCPAAAPA